MNNSPVKSELYVALEMVELTQFLPFTNFLFLLILITEFKHVHNIRIFRIKKWKY